LGITIMRISCTGANEPMSDSKGLSFGEMGATLGYVEQAIGIATMLAQMDINSNAQPDWKDIIALGREPVRQEQEFRLKLPQIPAGQVLAAAQQFQAEITKTIDQLKGVLGDDLEAFKSRYPDVFGA